MGWWLSRAGYSGVKNGWLCVLHELRERIIKEYKLQVPSDNKRGAPAQTNNKHKKNEGRRDLLFPREKKESWKREVKGKEEEERPTREKVA